MKLKIEKQSRQTTIIIFLVLLFICLAGLLWIYNVQSEQVIEFVDYVYSYRTDYNYLVHLSPNEVFPEEILQPGRVYVTALTDYITVNFSYYFSGERNADISGNYTVTAELVAQMAQDREDQILWEKNFEIIPRQNFSATEREIILRETFILPFSEYQELIEQIQAEIQVSPALINLIVKCQINFVAETDSGTIRENIVPVMIVPMRGATFYVEGNLTDETQGSLKRTLEKPITLVKTARVVLSFITIFIFLILVSFTFVTASKTRKISPEEKEVSHILKKYQDDIIRVKSNDSFMEGEKVAVDSFNDLLKVAEEVGKPILYLEIIKEDICESYFVIYTPELVYCYQINYKKVMVPGRKKIFLIENEIKSPLFVGAIIIVLLIVFIFSLIIINST